jgi:hypothetical protein
MLTSESWAPLVMTSVVFTDKKKNKQMEKGDMYYRELSAMQR